MPPAAVDPLLVGYLAGRDVPCPACGYNLRDLAGGRCPECGDALALRLGSSEPRQGLLIAGLVGLSAGAGLSGLLLVYEGIQLLRHQGMGAERGGFTGLPGGGLRIGALAAAAWLPRGRQIRRVRPAARVGLTLGCWGLTVANVLIFSFTIG